MWHLASLSNLQELTNKAILKVYQRKLKAGEVDQSMFSAIADGFKSEVEKGFGTPVKEGLRLSKKERKLYRFYVNTTTFAAYKNHSHILSLVKATRNNIDKQPASWTSFRDKALKLSKDYNENWLSAEYNAARSQSQAGRLWLDIEKDKDALPMLTYRTAGDSRVRAEHSVLDGVTLPIDDPFWDTYYPPNGFRCRCSVDQSSGTRKEPKGYPDVKPLFRNNPGKTGEVFNGSHPYFTSTKDEDKAAIFNAIDTYHTKTEGFTRGANEQVYEGGGSVITHPLHGKNEKVANQIIAGFIAKEGHTVHLMPVNDTPGKRSYDAKINGLSYEFKTSISGTPNSISKLLRSARYQAPNIVLYFPNKAKAYNQIAVEIERRVLRSPELISLCIIYDGQLYNFIRKDITATIMLTKIKWGE